MVHGGALGSGSARVAGVGAADLAGGPGVLGKCGRTTETEAARRKKEMQVRKVFCSRGGMTMRTSMQNSNLQKELAEQASSFQSKVAWLREVFVSKS